jgi:VPDSG-CTERM motif
MKRALITVTCAVALLSSAARVEALTLSITDAYYLGFIDPANPADPSDEVFYVNFLASLAPGTVQTGVVNPTNPSHSYTFTRDDNTFSGLESAVLVDHVRGTSTIIPNVSEFFYALAKYGTVSHVWVLNELTGEVTLPATAPGGGLSHATLFTTSGGTTPPGGGGGGGGPQVVPDGGATLGLLGFAMLALGFLRRQLT